MNTYVFAHQNTIEISILYTVAWIFESSLLHYVNNIQMVRVFVFVIVKRTKDILILKGRHSYISTQA